MSKNSKSSQNRDNHDHHDHHDHHDNPTLRSVPIWNCIQLGDDPNDLSCPAIDDSGCGGGCMKKCGCGDQANPNGGSANDLAGNPLRQQISGGPTPQPASQPRVGGEFKNVNLANGGVEVSSPSIGNAASLATVARLAYSNRLYIGSSFSTVDRGFGINWFLNLDARVINQGDDRIVFVLPGAGGEQYSFEAQLDATYLPMCGSTASMIATSTQYRLLVDGQQTVFDKTSGAILQTISPSGEVTDYLYVSGRLSEVVSQRTAGSNYVRQSLVLTYQAPSGSGSQPVTPLESIVQRVYVGTDSDPDDNDFDLQARMLFDIPAADDTVNSHYQARNLYRIHQQIPDGSGGWTTETTRMFIYYTTGDHAGFLKYVIEPAGYNGLSNPDTASDSQLMAASSAYYQYDSDFRVSRIETDGGTKWSTITYTENTNTPSDLPNNWKLKSVYTSNDGSVKTVFSNHQGSDMLVDETDGTDRWIYYSTFDAVGREIARYTPAAIDMSGTPWDQSSDDLDVQVKTGSGLIQLTAWYATTGSGAAAGRLESRSIKQGSSGTPILIFKREYTSRTIDGVTIYPVSKDTAYRSDTGTGDPIETTYTYTWPTDSLTPQTVTTHWPDVPTTQNGVAYPQSDVSIDQFNQRGQLIQTTDARGMETEYEYDSATGALIQQRRDVNGLDLVSDFTVDIRGRQIRSLGPVQDVDGVSIRTANWSVEVGNDETRTASGYQTVSTGNFTLVNPVSIRKRSADRTVVDQIVATRGSSVESSGELAETDSFPQTSWTAWTQEIHDKFGRPLSRRVYHGIPFSGPGTVGSNYIETTYDYDSMGRQNKVVSPDGTISRMVYNIRGQIISTWIGTDATAATDSDPTGGSATGNNMVQLTESEYDAGVGGGNGLRTSQTQFVNASSTENRVVQFGYDWRNRLIDTITTDGQYTFYQQPTVDNLGRATMNRTYREQEESLVLIAQSESFFDERGRLYRSKTYSVSDTGTVGNALQSNQWFNANGQVIKSSAPGSTAFTKTVYDGVGRATIVYSAYNDGLGTDDPTSVSSNIVLSESHSVYDEAGQTVSTTFKDRWHDATGNGPLNGPAGSNPKSRDSVSAMWYDGIGRSVAVANYGATTFTVARPSTAPASSDTVLVSSTEFDIAGRAFETTDPAGSVTQMEFDAAGRTTKTIQNSGGSDKMTVRTQYNAAGQLSKQIADNADTGNQETVYAYGVTLADSDLASNQLLASVTHPDSGVVSFDYDRTQQQIAMTDPNGTVHEYAYDAAGRRVADVVTTLGSGVDGSVRRIKQTYDNRLRLQKITSYDAVTAGSVTSDVRYAYNGFGQIVKEYQQHDAEVDTGTSPVVEYGYADGSANTIRMNSMNYPDGHLLNYDYGNAGSADDRLDRVSLLTEIVSQSIRTLASYQRTGAGMLVSQTYNEPGISKTLLTNPFVGQNDDPYTALDRFGRMLDLQWKKGSSDLVRFKYGYDRVSNRLFERNTISTGSNPAIDSLFGYDELNRMIDFKTGLLNSAGDVIASPVTTQSLTLDETGNISRNALASGSSLAPLTTTLDQTRDHNTVNEITDIDETVGPSWPTPSHDDAGNMISIPQPNGLTTSYTLIWDAWNRLISVANGLTTVATYRYDGTNRRIIKNKYVSGSLSETRHVYYSLQSQPLEERTGTATTAAKQFVWNIGYVDDLIFRDRFVDPQNDPPYERLYALSDLRFSIVALADDTGTIVERFKYDAHGRSSVMDSSFAARSSSSYNWEFRYTGRRQDLETGLYYFRARYYHAELGRFISRDPLGFTDGMSLYRAYFVPGGRDASGLKIGGFIGCTAAQQASLTTADAAVNSRIQFLQREIENLKGQVGARKIVNNYLREYGLAFEDIEVGWISEKKRSHLDSAIGCLQGALARIEAAMRRLRSTILVGYDADCCSCGDQYNDDDDVPQAYVTGKDYWWSRKINFCPGYFDLPATSAAGSFRNPASNQASILLHELSHLSFWTTDDNFRYLERATGAGGSQDYRGEFLNSLTNDAYFYQNLQDNSISKMLDPGIYKVEVFDLVTDEFLRKDRFLNKGILFYLLVPGRSQNLGP